MYIVKIFVNYIIFNDIKYFKEALSKKERVIGQNLNGKVVIIQLLTSGPLNVLFTGR
jgi:hypothetical protein